MTNQVVAARETARDLLGGTSDRWWHSQAAAAAAAEAAASVDEADRDLLVAAAWVHDIGYRHPYPPTGFHPVDGARLLLDRGWPRRLAALVAHHSEARFAASARGLSAELAEFEHEGGAVTDALVYADLTAGPDGHRVTLTERFADVHRRHRAESAPLRAARRAREPHLVLSIARVEVRLRRLGAAHHDAFGAPHPPAAAVQAALRVVSARHRHRDPLDTRAALLAAGWLLPPGATPEEMGSGATRLLDLTGAGRWTQPGGASLLFPEAG